MDEDYMNYLRVRRNAHTRSWNSNVVMDALAADPYYADHKEAHHNACKEMASQLHVCLDAPEIGTNLLLDYVGNHDLLASVEKVSLVCHRADEGRFAEQVEAVMYSARQECVVVSAFVSAKEREVRSMLLRESLPFIEVVSYGFGVAYHPTGDVYDACVAGRLAQISPWTAQYNQDNRLTRDKCLVMNELVRTICKISDDWWKRD